MILAGPVIIAVFFEPGGGVAVRQADRPNLSGLVLGSVDADFAITA